MDAAYCGMEVEVDAPSIPLGGRTGMALSIGSFLYGGTRPIYDLRLIDVSRHGVYLSFESGATISEGEVFRIVRPLRRRTDAVLRRGEARKVVARVKVLRVEDPSRALVQVLQGSVIRGIGAESASHTQPYEG